MDGDVEVYLVEVAHSDDPHIRGGGSLPTSSTSNEIQDMIQWLHFNFRVHGILC